MEKEDFIKVINGEIYYRSDYCYWLYTQLDKLQKKINNAIDYIGKNKKIIEFGYSAKLECNAYELLDILRGDDNES